MHVNLLKRSHWWLDSTKMEAASFIIFDTAHLKFQIGDPDAYFVHHMSMFEHLLHKKKGFDVAKTKTLTMSELAFIGECNDLKPQNTREFIGIIPFYGGLPPNVTGDLRVKSLGQGNSLVDAGTKALQVSITMLYYIYTIVYYAILCYAMLCYTILHIYFTAYILYYIYSICE